MNERLESRPKLLKSWIAAICILALGTTLYSEIEGEWFSSYVKYIAQVGFFNVGVIYAVSKIVGTIFYMIWGAVSDNARTKFGRRVPFLVIGMFTTALFMILYISTTNFIFLLIIGGVILAITSNMFHVTNKSLIVDLVPQERRGRMQIKIFLFGMMGSMIVWIPAIFLLPEGQASFSQEMHVLFISMGALSCVLVGISVGVLVKEPKIDIVPKNWLIDIKNLFNPKEMLKHKGFLKIFVAMIFLIMSKSAYYPFMLIFFQEIPLDFAEIIIALPFVITIIIVGIFFMGKLADTRGRKITTIISLFLSPIGGVLIILAGSSSFMLFLGFAIMFAFIQGVWIAADAWVQDLLPKEKRGSFLGIINIGNALGSVPGVLIAGLVADALGLSWVFFVSGIILWIALPFFSIVPETIIKKGANKKD